MSIELIRGDITAVEVDAVVNAANSTLLGGGGVDGAIHEAAGPGLLEECRALGGCPPGEARVTSGHLLRARWVIHTVGPVWQGGNAGEAEVLARCYDSVFDAAAEIGAASIALPAISTGAFGYPVRPATEIAVKRVSARMGRGLPERAVFVCFDEVVYEVYRELLG